MKLLIVHNEYIHRGGEDVCVQNEITAMKDAGLEITEYRIRTTATARTAYQAALAPWGKGHEKQLETLLHNIRPDVVHIHNLYPLLSPRFFERAKRGGCKVLLTLHNYRPLCLNGLFLTPSNAICERCAGGNYWHGILRGCYRGNRVQSVAIAGHIALARKRKWYDWIDCFISPSIFLKQKFIQWGFPDSKIIVQGHFLPALPESDIHAPEPYLLYMGRLSEEKGIRWLLNVFQNPHYGLKLHIAGQGPLQSQVEKHRNNSIHYRGFLSGEEKQLEIQRATALVMPSECYENLPLAIMEANAWGTPALVSGLGGLAETITEGDTGLSYEPRNAASFWAMAKRILDEYTSTGKRLRCRQFARERFSKEAFLAKRMKLYSAAPFTGAAN